MSNMSTSIETTTTTTAASRARNERAKRRAEYAALPPRVRMRLEAEREAWRARQRLIATHHEYERAIAEARQLGAKV